MMNIMKRIAKLVAIAVLCTQLSACDDPQVYGSVGVSSWGGSYGGSRVGGSVSIGGRIF